jgi:hypothetical protein
VQLQFFQRLFQAAATKLPDTGGSRTVAADNFFLAACAGARADLTTFFRENLNWPITAAALARVPEMIAP